MNSSKNNLPQNLRTLRAINGLSQKALAEDLGVSRNKIASYESRNIEPSLSLILNMSSYFNISVDDLLRQEIDESSYEKLRSRYLAKLEASESLNTSLIENEDLLKEFISKNDRVTRVYEGLKAYREMMSEGQEKDNLKQFEEIIDYLLNNNKSIIEELRDTN